MLYHGKNLYQPRGVVFIHIYYTGTREIRNYIHGLPFTDRGQWESLLFTTSSATSLSRLQNKIRHSLISRKNSILTRRCLNLASIPSPSRPSSPNSPPALKAAESIRPPSLWMKQRRFRSSNGCISFWPNSKNRFPIR